MCGTASGWAKLALACMMVGMIMHIAGWATINWMIYQTSGNVLEIDVGLWQQKTCTNGVCDQNAVQSLFEKANFNVVRALETVVFCGVVLGFILMAVYVFFENTRRQPFAIVLMVLCFISGALSFVGMIIWLINIPSPFVVSFSMGLTVIGLLLVLIAGTLLIPDVFEPRDPYHRSETVTPYTPRSDRRTIVTPISYRGEQKAIGYRW